MAGCTPEFHQTPTRSRTPSVSQERASISPAMSASPIAEPAITRAASSIFPHPLNTFHVSSALPLGTLPHPLSMRGRRFPFANRSTGVHVESSKQRSTNVIRNRTDRARGKVAKKIPDFRKRWWPAPAAAHKFDRAGGCSKKGTDHSVPNPHAFNRSQNICSGQSGLSPFSNNLLRDLQRGTLQ